jgi:hypothetical protein
MTEEEGVICGGDAALVATAETAKSPSSSSCLDPPAAAMVHLDVLATIHQPTAATLALTTSV